MEKDKRIRWTEDQLEYLKANYLTRGPQGIAKDLNKTLPSVLMKASRLRISTRKPPPKNFEWTEENLQILKDRYVQEGGRVLAEEWNLNVGTVWTKAAELGLHTIAGHISTGRKRAETSTRVDVRYFDTWSANMAYILGFIFADGCVSNDKYHRTLALCLSQKDQCVLEFIKSELKFQGNLHTLQLSKRQIDGREVGPTTQVSLMIGSTIIVEKLLSLGVHPRKTYRNDALPDIPEEYMRDFIRGILDGDGTVSITSKDVCAVGFLATPIILLEIKDHLVDKLGIRDNAIQKKIYKNTKLCTVVWTSLKDLKKLKDYIYYEGVGFCLDRKRKRLEEWLSKPRYSKGCYPR